MTAYCSRCPGPLDLAAQLTSFDWCTDCERRDLDTAIRLKHRGQALASAAPIEHRPLGKITPEEWATFTEALSSAARGGEVHQRDMRPLIRGRIRSQIIPSCYSRAISLHLIREVRRERSNDVIGRNTNKDEPVYALGVNANRSAA